MKNDRSVVSTSYLSNLQHGNTALELTLGILTRLRLEFSFRCNIFTDKSTHRGLIETFDMIWMVFNGTSTWTNPCTTVKINDRKSCPSLITAGCSAGRSLSIVEPKLVCWRVDHYAMFQRVRWTFNIRLRRSWTCYLRRGIVSRVLIIDLLPEKVGYWNYVNGPGLDFKNKNERGLTGHGPECSLIPFDFSSSALCKRWNIKRGRPGCVKQGPGRAI